MKLTSLIEGIGLGAVAMFLLDPDRGVRRRALLRDQMVHQANRKRRAVSVMTHDFVNRTKGMRYKVQGQLKREAVSDEILVERARAEIGHRATHSGSIHVTCEAGVLTLVGPILFSELDGCLRALQMLPGVKQIANNLDTHVSGDRISALQGGRPRPVLNRWTPATCFVMGIAGVLCIAYGRSRKGVVGGAMRVGGMGLITKAFHDTEQRFDPLSSPPRFVGAQESKDSTRKALPTMDGAESVTEKGHAGMV